MGESDCHQDNQVIKLHILLIAELPVIKDSHVNGAFAVCDQKILVFVFQMENPSRALDGVR
jgi:hypothetical protein